MGGLTPINWRDFEKFLRFVGCQFLREKGDHQVWGRLGLKRPIVFPKISNIPVFVIRNNLRLLDFSVANYLDVIDKL